MDRPDLPPQLHKQVHKYLRASQSLISAAMASQQTFSEEEVRLVAYYLDAVAKVLKQPAYDSTIAASELATLYDRRQH